MISWIHPIVVHFVIGLLLLGTLFDVIGSLRNSDRMIFAGYCNIIAAAIFSIVAVATGLLAQAHLGPHSSIGDALLSFHETFSITVMILAIVLAGWRIAMRGAIAKSVRTIYLGVAFAACAMLFMTGTVGGVLVFWYGFGMPPETARRVIEAQPLPPTPPHPAVQPAGKP